MKSSIKTFKRYLKEERNKFYTLDLPRELSKEDVTYLMNELLNLTFKMRKEGDVRVILEPVPEMDEV